MQETAAAEVDLRLALEVLTPLQTTFDLARAYLLLAALQHEQHQSDAATLWREALTRISRGGYAFLLEQERALAFPLLAQSLNDDSPDMVNLCAAAARSPQARAAAAVDHRHAGPL